MGRKVIITILVALLSMHSIASRDENVVTNIRPAPSQLAPAPNKKSTAMAPPLPINKKVQNSEPPPFDQSKLLPVHNRLLCELREIHANVPIDGKVQIISTLLPPYDLSEERSAWIKSPECPDGRHSIVHFGPGRKISLEKDCRTASLTELTMHSGMQGQINDAHSKGDSLNLAISGPGHFLLKCPKGDMLLTRDGKVKKNSRGFYQNQSECLLLNTHGAPFAGHAKIGQDGCAASGECLSIAYPSSEDSVGLRYRSANSFTTNRGFGATASAKREPGTRVVLDALEDLVNEPGRTSVSWEHEKKFDLDSLDCSASMMF